MKRNITILLFLLFSVMLFGTQRYEQEFISTDVATISADSTATNGTDFTSREIDISTRNELGAIQIWFTRSASTTYTVDFYFQCSIDDAENWDTRHYVRIRVATDSDAVGSVVKKTSPIAFYGISNIRLFKVVNTDPSNDITVVNCRLAI